MIAEDKEKNKGISYKEALNPAVSYEITFKDNRDIKQTDYDWFITNLSDISKIKRIIISFRVSYSYNTMDRERPVHKSVNTYVTLHEDRVVLRVDGVRIEDEVYNHYSKIREILEKGDTRYNKTIKNRNIRIQSFCLSIGFVLSYILYFIINGMKTDLPEILTSMLDSKYVLVFGQWFVSAILGNVFGYAIIMSYYKNLIPRSKYSHYSTSSNKSVYVDDIANYTNECEVQIGKNANNGKNREKIEKIFKVTSKIVLAQVLIGIILFLTIK